MPGSFTLRLDGTAQMQRRLLGLIPQVQHVIAPRAVAVGAQLVVSVARKLAPVDTGRLRDAIAYEAVPDAKDPTVAIGVRRPVSRRLHFVEFGTRFQAAQPFMRPAMDGSRGQMLQLMARAFDIGINRVLGSGRR